MMAEAVGVAVQAEQGASLSLMGTRRDRRDRCPRTREELPRRTRASPRAPEALASNHPLRLTRGGKTSGLASLRTSVSPISPSGTRGTASASSRLRGGTNEQKGQRTAAGELALHTLLRTRRDASRLRQPLHGAGHDLRID